MSNKKLNKQNKNKGNVAVKIVAGLLVLFTVLGSCFSFIYYLVANI